jgi:hypothetical protein
MIPATTMFARTALHGRCFLPKAQVAQLGRKSEIGCKKGFLHMPAPPPI